MDDLRRCILISLLPLLVACGKDTVTGPRAPAFVGTWDLQGEMHYTRSDSTTYRTQIVATMILTDTVFSGGRASWPVNGTTSWMETDSLAGVTSYGFTYILGAMRGDTISLILYVSPQNTSGFSLTGLMTDSMHINGLSLAAIPSPTPPQAASGTWTAAKR